MKASYSEIYDRYSVISLTRFDEFLVGVRGGILDAGL